METIRTTGGRERDCITTPSPPTPSRVIDIIFIKAEEREEKRAIASNPIPISVKSCVHVKEKEILLVPSNEIFRSVQYVHAVCFYS